MAETKIGFSQVGKPEPLWYRRLSDALVMFIIPGACTVVAGWGLSDKIANHWLLALGYAPAVIKGIGKLLGNGQVYSPSNEKVDADAPLNNENKQP